MSSTVLDEVRISVAREQAAAWPKSCWNKWVRSPSPCKTMRITRCWNPDRARRPCGHTSMFVACSKPTASGSGYGLLCNGFPGVERPEHIRWREVADQDWERAWMDRFRPMKFGRCLWIVPSGMQIPYAAQNIEIRLDPGLAFGTGTHPTTALCLEWLDGRDLAGQAWWTMAAGQAILGIAAALKGASRVICVDNDPQALEQRPRPTGSEMGCRASWNTAPRKSSKSERLMWFWPIFSRGH